MMQNFIELLNKTYDKHLCDKKAFYKPFKKQAALLQEYQINVAMKTDCDIFQCEIILYSIHVKQAFEAVFLDTYVTMFDYWYELTYLERKKQMNLDIERLMDTLPSFMIEDSRIFMPCFDASFNRLYTEEIVLLDLKQYHVFMNTFVDQIHPGLYGVEPYRQACSSAQVLATGSHAFVLYHPLVHRFYHYLDGACVNTLSLDPKNDKEEDAAHRELAALFLLQDEDALLQMLVEKDFVHAKMKKRLQKYQLKKAKKQRKETNS